MPLGPPPFRTPFLDAKGLVEGSQWQRHLVDLNQDLSQAAPNDAFYLVLTANLKLPNRSNLGSLTTGFLFITVAAGTATPSTQATISAAVLSGILPDAVFPALLPVADGSQLTNLDATELVGTLPNATFPAVLPVADGSLLTNLNGADVTRSVVTKTFTDTGYVALGDQTVLVNATGGATTILLPLAPAIGVSVTVKKTDVSANSATIGGNGSTIDGAATLVLAAQWKSATVIGNGTAWFVTGVV